MKRVKYDDYWHYGYFPIHYRDFFGNNLDKVERVTISEFSLRVGNRVYPLDQISKFGIERASPNRMLAILTIASGVILTITGLFFSTITIVFGLILSALGILVLLRSRKLYVLRIVLSKTETMDIMARKEGSQLREIVNALNKRFSIKSTAKDDLKGYYWSTS